MHSFKKIIEDVNTERNRIYTSIAIFLTVISIFIVFAIRPVLVIAFELVQKEKELVAKNIEYEEVIAQITSIQSALQQIEGRLDILTEAVPERASINTMINDVQRAATGNGVVVSKITGGDIDLVRGTQSSKSYVIDLQSSGEFENIYAFQQALYRQRRLKGIQKIDIVKNEQVATDSAGLRFAIEIVGYYL